MDSASDDSSGKDASAQHHIHHDQVRRENGKKDLHPSAQFSGPIRSLSPDAFSDSADELQDLGSSALPAMTSGSRELVSRALSPRSWKDRLDAFWAHNRGIIYMLLSQFFGTLMNVATRILEVEGNHGAGMAPFQVIFTRMSITVVLSSTYMFYTKTPDFPLGAKGVRWLLVARSLGGFFGVFGMYFSLLYLSLSDAVVITFLAPGIACWACSILINEPFTRKEQLASLVSLVGVALIARPTTLFSALTSSPDPVSPPMMGNDTTSSANVTVVAPHDADALSYDNITPAQRLTAVGIALIGVLGAASAYTTIRWIGKRAHPLISVNYFATWCTMVSFVMLLVLPDESFVLPADLREWGLLISLGISGFVMQFLLAASLSHERSSRATNMIYVQELYALGFDKLIFGHLPDAVSIIGSSLIVGGAVVAAMQKAPQPEKQIFEIGSDNADEESQLGLISGEAVVRSANDTEVIPMQEMEIRPLR